MISFSQEPNRGKTSVFGAYMRRLSGKSRDSNSETKHRTESSELRSRAMTTISELGNSATIRAFASSAAFRLRAGSTSLAPRFASTRAVSAPIPDVAPGNWTTPSSSVKQTTIFNSSCNGNHHYCWANSPVMTAVTEPRSGQFSVTSSAVDLEPYPLAPNEPRRYFRASSICQS